MNSIEQKNKLIDEIALKINDLQNERQKAENEAYLKYMDDCVELLEEYGIFPRDRKANDKEVRNADLILDYIKLKRKQCEYPVVPNRAEEYVKEVLEAEQKEMQEKAAKEFDEFINGQQKSKVAH